MAYIQNENLEIKQSSAFGLGILAPYLGESLPILFDNIMQTLIQMINTPKKHNDMMMYYSSAKDNAVSSMGKLMKINWNNIDQLSKEKYLNFWVSQLPLLQDHKEGFQSHELLIKLLQSNCQLVLGKNFHNLIQVIRIFERIYQKQLISSPELDALIKSIIYELVQNQSAK